MTTTPPKPRKLRPVQREQAVLGSLSFARQQASLWARKMRRQRPWLDARELFDDMYSAAVLGLQVAARKFDPRRGFTFLTYAAKWVLHHLQAADRHWHPLGPSFVPHGAQPRVSRAGSDPGVVRPDSYRDGEVSAPPWDMVAGRDAPGDLMADDVERLLSLLHPQQRDVVRRHLFGGLNFREIGQALGLSRERCRQIYDAALERLRSSPTVRRLHAQSA